MNVPNSFLSGVVEGFYGRPWNPSQRRQLFEWLRIAGLNAYLYAPKDNIKHRALWREPYDPTEAAGLRSLIDDCAAAGIEFVYALSPGLDIRFTQPDDLAALEAKLHQAQELGAAHLAVLWDDLAPGLSPEDARHYSSPAAAHCAVSNRVLPSVRARRPGTRLLFCPTIYCAAFAQGKVPENDYLRTVGKDLDPAIEVLWTGPEIISETISVASIRELAAVIRRQPMLWDNLPANDYDMRRLHLGPYSGRPAELRAELTGILLNPNCQFEANYVGIRTLGDYVRPGTPPAPRTAYRQALEAWLPSFATRGRASMTLEDLQRLGDVFHLPTAFGERAQRYLDDVQALLRLPPDQWGETLARFEQANRDFAGLYDKITELTDRDLCHALYAHVWELKETTQLLAAWVRWRRGNPESTEAFASGEFRPRIWRGGLTALLDRLLPIDEHGKFHPT